MKYSLIFVVFALVLLSCKSDKEHSHGGVATNSDSKGPESRTSETTPAAERPKKEASEVSLSEIQDTIDQETDQEIEQSRPEEITVLERYQHNINALKKAEKNWEEVLPSLSNDLFSLLDTDTSNSDLGRVSPARQSTLELLARLLTDLPGDGLENLLSLINFRVRGNDVDDQGSRLEIDFSPADEIQKIQTLFSLLLGERAHSIDLDIFLLHFMNIKNISFESTTDRPLTDGELDYMPVQYFSERIKKFSQAGYHLTELFNSYALLGPFLSSESLFKVWENYLADLEIKEKTTFAGHKVFNQILKQINIYDQNSLHLVLSSLFMESVLFHGRWKLSQGSQHDFFNSRQVMDTLTQVILAFDRPSKNYNLNQEEWIHLQEMKINFLFQDVRSYLQLLFQREEFSVLSFGIHHPLLEMIMHLTAKNFNERNILRSLVVRFSSFQDYSHYFYDRLEQLNGDVTGLGNREVQYFNNSTQIGSGLEWQRRLVISFYELMKARFYLDFSTLIKSALVDSQNDERLRVYKNAFHALISSLNLRAELNGLSQINSNRLRRSSRDLNAQITLLEAWPQISDVADYLEEQCDQEENKIILPAGLYVPKKGLNLICLKEIEFHPLALIYAPGKNLEIFSQGLTFPWIDTSGHHARAAVPYSESGASAPVQISNVINDEYQRGTRYRFEPVQNPRKQRDGLSGSHAGRIVLRLATAPSPWSLFVSNGGNGSRGINGFDVLAPFTQVRGNEVRYRPMRLKSGLDGGYKIHDVIGYNDRIGEPVMGYVWKTSRARESEVHMLAGEGGNGGHGGDSMTPEIQTRGIYDPIILAIPGQRGRRGDAGIGHQQNRRHGQHGKAGVRR